MIDNSNERLEQMKEAKKALIDTLVIAGIPYGKAAVAIDMADQATMEAYKASKKTVDLLEGEDVKALAQCIANMWMYEDLKSLMPLNESIYGLLVMSMKNKNEIPNVRGSETIN